MARFKHYDYSQSKLLPVCFEDQIQPGTFEYAINFLIDQKLDLNVFHNRYRNDKTGAPAYDPAILLKIVLFAYSRGIPSSRQIERCCQENVVFMALSADSQPHFTTIAEFISSMGDVITGVFQRVLLVCDEMGLIGREMFAIDGCKLPSNASKRWSGTHEELKHKQAKIEKAVKKMLQRHQSMDGQGEDLAIADKAKKQRERLEQQAKKIDTFLETNDKRIGHRGKEVKSNVTDNESAKMATSHGVIQGYNGIAAVDQDHQVILHAEAYGEGAEQPYLQPMIEGVQANYKAIHSPVTVQTMTVTADSGFHSKAGLAYLDEQQIEGLIADHRFRKRDPQFEAADRYKPKKKVVTEPLFSRHDFHYDPDQPSCTCPAGKTMWLKNQHAKIGNVMYVTFQGYRTDCRSCPKKQQCLGDPNQVDGRQVSFPIEKIANSPTLIQRMVEKIDSPEGRQVYNQRLGTVEPVFGNIRETKGLSRFSLRGKAKVNIQWLLYCLVHNIEKIQHYGAIPV